MTQSLLSRPHDVTGSSDDPSVKLCIGIVGAGEQATTHLIPALLQIPHVELGAIADVDERRAAEVAMRFGIPRWFGDAPCLLDGMKVDAVVAACPPQAHEQIISCAIERRVPVFVEKPPTVTTSALCELAARAAASGVLVGVGMNFRHAGPYRRVKEVLADPDAGVVVLASVRHVASKPRRPLWGLSLLRSVLLAQAIHPVDLLLDLCGAVTDVRVLRRLEPQDVLVGAQLAFREGAHGGLVCGTHAPRFDTRIELITDAGVMIGLSGLAELTIAGLPAAKAAGGSRGWSQQWRPSPLDTGYERTGFLGELASFIACVAADEPFVPGLDDLVATYEVLDALEHE
jgi:phthalate 4,5-cis-dihydrodiol dehydrogenase